ncbi:hypothetical protein JMJ35_008277 [Cladonia borealis]|uniref:C2H2-type domain-containing protein n=1 Tax=Cladonia borealis TaxID=184061 RepID=A0AA39QUZ1_9LECA|nr:hypothetical protein JMJ35_008277 [Cladonia borealis]
MDPWTPNTPLSLAELGPEPHYNGHFWDPYSNFTEANGFQANHNILLAQGYPYGSYLAATPYDPRFEAYPPTNVSTTGMAPYATMPYDPALQTYPPANVLTPGLAPCNTPYETGTLFAQGHAFAATTRTTTTPNPTPTNNSNPNNSSNPSTAGKHKVSKRRSICTTCGRDFSRASDMQRHAKKHGVSKYFQCTVEGCEYAGSYRKDKLEQHVRNVH